VIFFVTLGVTLLAAPTLMRTSVAADNRAGTQSGETQTAELLFVQSAASAVLKDGVLRLGKIHPTTIFFSDRPERVAGHWETKDFLDSWGMGENNFVVNPPNATLSILSGAEPQEIVVTLKSPRMDGDDLLYEVAVLEGNQSAEGDASSLFIDIIGRPLTPLSVAGVRRRTIRRAVRRGW
jgi:hypothetical protein